MAIESRVARILSGESVVLNRGSAQGVREGMRFVVFAEAGEVSDPETGNSLGKLELVKARLVASHVQENMTICTAEPDATFASEDPELHTLSAEMVAVSMQARRPQPAKLNVNRAEVTGLPKAAPIAVGDPARSVD